MEKKEASVTVTPARISKQRFPSATEPLLYNRTPEKVVAAYAALPLLADSDSQPIKQLDDDLWLRHTIAPCSSRPVGPVPTLDFHRSFSPIARWPCHRFLQNRRVNWLSRAASCEKDNCHSAKEIVFSPNVILICNA